MKKLFGPVRKLKSSIKNIGAVKLIFGLALLVAVSTVIVSGYIYWNKPERVSKRVFWGAVNQNLKTSSFSRYSTIKNAGQSSNQQIDVFITPKQGIHSQTRFVQTGLDEAEALTENLGTPHADYVRYTKITSSQKNSKGEKYDFSRIIGVWGGTKEDNNKTNGQQFGQSILTSIPVGNLTSEQRIKLIKMMQDSKVYEFSKPQVSRDGMLFRPTYSYTVKLKPVEYVKILKQFGEYVGLNQLNGLNPDDYKNVPDTAFQITVDGWSKTITSIVEPGSSRREYISGRNALKVMPGIPRDSVNMSELQSRLQSIE